MEHVKERIWYWDLLRVAAMLFLVVRHSATASFEFVTMLGRDWWICNVYGSLSAWMVPVFMMISGANFLEPNRNITIKKLYFKNIWHMLVVFFFWSAFYAIYNVLAGQTGGKGFWTMFLEGHFHLWFLPMIIGIYMLVPLLRVVTIDGRYIKWMVLVTGVAGVVIPSLQDLDLILDSSILSISYSFGMLSAYVCFFYLGYWLHQHTFSSPQRMVIYSIGIFATILVFVGTYYLTLRDGVHNEDMQSDNNLLTCLQGVAIFVGCKTYCSKRQLKASTCKFLQELSGLTFGVYMIHVVFLALLDRLGFSTTTYPAQYMIPMTIGFTIPASFLLSWLIRKIPFIGKAIT